MKYVSVSDGWKLRTMTNIYRFWSHWDDVKRFTCPPVRTSLTPVTEFRNIRAAKPRQRVQRVLWAAITSGSAVSLLTRLCPRLWDLIYRLRRICDERMATSFSLSETPCRFLYEFPSIGYRISPLPLLCQNSYPTDVYAIHIYIYIYIPICISAENYIGSALSFSQNFRKSFKDADNSCKLLEVRPRRFAWVR